MREMVDHEIFELANGIRIVHKEVSNSKIVHCGFIFDIGSRDEKHDQSGLAHFWEHMAFKGTEHRKAFHIINRLESVGGELNAYTTKEKICFYASTLAQHFEKSVDLLSDIAFHSVFPERQIENERGVILEEMSLYADAPEDAIQDDFEDLIYHGHPLGRNILGTRSSVSSFQKKDFHNFIRENLDTSRIIFSVVGNMPFAKVLKIAKKYIDALPSLSAIRTRIPVDGYIAKTKLLKKPINQAHCAIGCTAYPLSDNRRLPFLLLSNILGGPGLNSRLNLQMREKYGYVYSIDAQYSAYSDTGIFAIYFATEMQKMSRCVDLVLKEFNKLKYRSLGNLQLHRAKEQFIGQMAIAEENNTNLMLMMGKSLLDMSLIETFDEVVDQINAINEIELMEVANEIWQDDRYSFLYFIPEKK